jgi:hypothetical protein
MNATYKEIRLNSSIDLVLCVLHCLERDETDGGL